jgi:hypothetical protein
MKNLTAPQGPSVRSTASIIGYAERARLRWDAIMSRGDVDVNHQMDLGIDARTRIVLRCAPFAKASGAERIKPTQFQRSASPRRFDAQ